MGIKKGREKCRDSVMEESNAGPLIIDLGDEEAECGKIVEEYEADEMEREDSPDLIHPPENEKVDPIIGRKHPSGWTTVN